MKKVFIALFIGLLVSSYAFTQEFIISPALGYAGMGFIGDAKVEVKTVSNTTPPVTVNTSTDVSAVSSMHLMEIGLTSGSISKNGFTFMFNTFAAPTTGSGKITFKFPNDIKVDYTRNIKKGVEFGMSAILGRTFKYLDNKLYFNIGSGLAGRLMMVDSYYDGTKFNDRQPSVEVCFGIPIQAGIQYFFTDSFGINVLVADEVGVGTIDMGQNGVSNSLGRVTTTVGGFGFSNVFSVKSGPVFRIQRKR